MPLVSVIIPMYNNRETIDRSVGSVFEQTVSDWELVVVDDGSTDGSDKVLQGLVSGHHWVKVVRQSNAGAAAARNRGIEEANSELVAFLDADDQWTPNFLESVLSLRERFPDCAVWGTRYLVAGQGGQRLTPAWTGLPEAEGVIENYLATAGGYPPLKTGSAIISKECLERAGGFPEGIGWGEDLDTWLRLSIHCDFALSPRAYLIYHTAHSDRMSLSSQARDYPLLGVETEREYAEKISLLRRHEMTEYFNWMRLVAARDCLRLGQKKTAKELIWLARNTERFRPSWRSTSFKSHLPGWLMRLLAGIRGRF
ncbi:glycosyltransferase family 2 protein [Gemmatimonadota bacterium]